MMMMTMMTWTLCSGAFPSLLDGRLLPHFVCEGVVLEFIHAHMLDWRGVGIPGIMDLT